MSETVPAGVYPRSPVAGWVARRRGRRLARRYWYLWRPGRATYLRAAVSVAIYRVIAAAAISVSITLCAFLGVVLGNMSYPRWSAMQNLESGWAVSVAAVPAFVQLNRLIPVIAIFGIALAVIPRPYIWIFRIAIAGGSVLGFYQRYVPAFAPPAAYAGIARQTALAANWTQSHLVVLSGAIQATLAPPAKQQASWVAAIYIAAALMILVLASVCYGLAFVLVARTCTIVPRRPTVHSYSAFYVTSLTRRLAAALVSAALLVFDVWALRNLHASLPAVHFGVALFNGDQIAAIGWLVTAVGAALMTCVPRPRGRRGLWLAVLIAVTAYAVSARGYPFRLPTWLPSAPHGFWTIAIAYLVVSALCIDLVGGLLDWPFYLPLFARSTRSPTVLR